MARIKEPSNANAIVREPEAGTPIERRDIVGKDGQEAPASPKTAGAAKKDGSPLTEPFAARKSDAPPAAGKTPRPTDKPGV